MNPVTTTIIDAILCLPNVIEAFEVVKEKSLSVEEEQLDTVFLLWEVGILCNGFRVLVLAEGKKKIGITLEKLAVVTRRMINTGLVFDLIRFGETVFKLRECQGEIAAINRMYPDFVERELEEFRKIGANDLVSNAIFDILPGDLSDLISSGVEIDQETFLHLEPEGKTSPPGPLDAFDQISKQSKEANNADIALSRYDVPSSMSGVESSTKAGPSRSMTLELAESTDC
ncbi:hypothetical protein HDU76_004955 [Blyttiomyces sp. JEL0837]|nr:hypothetical protein HDU76_004955 [Blyttiomyces sp. JEL0837]